MNESQLTKIRDYLLTKKLPIDILIEVQDHFITQISSIQQEENLEFATAFANVKETWRKELNLSWKGEMSLMDSTDFMRKMSKQIYWDNFILTLKYSIPYVLIIFLIANFSNPLFFLIFFLASIFISIFWAIINYIKNFRDFRLPKTYGNNVITLHQDGIMIWILIVPHFLNIIGFGGSEIIKFQKMFLFQNIMMDSWKTIIVFVGVLILIGGISYSIICQKKYINQIKIVKPFLIYLKKTA